MISLIVYICELLQCEAATLGERLRDAKELVRVCRALRGGRIATTHLKENHQIVFDGFTMSGANGVIVKKPDFQHTVQQHLFVTLGVVLTFPNLPCVISFSEDGGVEYSPIELLTWNIR